MIVGGILRDYRYTPEEISINWKELPRDEKCFKDGCPYKINSNTDIGKGAYCCNSCMDSLNTHGKRCEKIIYNSSVILNKKDSTLSNKDE